MADDKKKNVLLDKLLGKKRTEALPDDEGASLDKQTMMNEDGNYPSEYEDWLTDVAAETSSDPDEDISEALAELFGEETDESANETSIFTIPGFEELAAEGEKNFNLYVTEDTEQVPAISEQYDEYSNEPDYSEINDEISAEDAEEEIQELEVQDDGEVPQSDDLTDYPEEEPADEEIGEEEKGAAHVDDDMATLLAALGYSDGAGAGSATKVKSHTKENLRRPSDLSLAYGYEGKEYAAR
jgi:hypothetical protein